MNGIRKCSNFILLHIAVQFSLHHLLKMLSSLCWIFLPPLSKIRCPKVLGFISRLSILLHWFFQFKNWYVSPSVYVIIDFFHQRLIVLFIQLFCAFIPILLLLLPWWMELILYFLFQIFFFFSSALELNGFLCVDFVSCNLTKLTD